MRSVVAALALLPFVASAQPHFAHPDRIRYDGQCFTINGKDTLIFSGAFHYFRCPQPLWKERIRLIKAAGFNCVETYVPWNYHERTAPTGLDDYSKVDLKEFDAFLSLLEKEGLYAIVRPGPFICAEWATGGYPQWLVAKKPAQPKRNVWLRSDDPTYLAWSNHWLHAVAKVLKRHELPNRPKGATGTILVQIENEYDHLGQPLEAKTEHLRDLVRLWNSERLTVPLFTCITNQTRGSKDPLLSQVFDTPNMYPGYKIEVIAERLKLQHDSQMWAPKMVTEEQGGWFSAVGGQMAEEQPNTSAAQINALTLRGLSVGQAAINYYMLFGGTNFGDWGGINQTASYDYNAPIREWGGTSPKYRAVAAIGDFLRRFGSELTRTEETSVARSPEPSVQVWSRKSAQGAKYVYVHNSRRDKSWTGNVTVEGKPVSVDLGPFGFKVYRYESEPSQGDWWPKLPTEPTSTPLPAAIRLKQATIATLTPVQWKPYPLGKSLAEVGVFGSETVAFQLPPVSEVAVMGGELRKSSTGEAIYINPGYKNSGPQVEEPRGLKGDANANVKFTTQFAAGPEKRVDLDGGALLTRISRINRIAAPDYHPLVRVRVQFDKPALSAKFAWNAVIDAAGDGFLVLNGHPLGRYWSVGPQRGFYLPECWLEKKNVLEITLAPDSTGNPVRAVELQPIAK